MEEQTRAEHHVLLALSPPQGTAGGQTKAGSGDHHHALHKGPWDSGAPVPWAATSGEGLH